MISRTLKLSALLTSLVLVGCGREDENNSSPELKPEEGPVVSKESQESEFGFLSGAGNFNTRLIVAYADVEMLDGSVVSFDGNPSCASEVNSNNIGKLVFGQTSPTPTPRPTAHNGAWPASFADGVSIMTGGAWQLQGRYFKLSTRLKMRGTSANPVCPSPYYDWYLPIEAEIKAKLISEGMTDAAAQAYLDASKLHYVAPIFAFKNTYGCTNYSNPTFVWQCDSTGFYNYFRHENIHNFGNGREGDYWKLNATTGLGYMDDYADVSGIGSSTGVGYWIHGPAKLGWGLLTDYQTIPYANGTYTVRRMEASSQTGQYRAIRMAPNPGHPLENGVANNLIFTFRGDQSAIAYTGISTGGWANGLNIHEERGNAPGSGTWAPVFRGMISTATNNNCQNLNSPVAERNFAATITVNSSTADTITFTVTTGTTSSCSKGGF